MSLQTVAGHLAVKTTHCKKALPLTAVWSFVSGFRYHHVVSHQRHSFLVSNGITAAGSLGTFALHAYNLQDQELRYISKRKYLPAAMHATPATIWQMSCAKPLFKW